MDVSFSFFSFPWGKEKEKETERRRCTKENDAPNASLIFFRLFFSRENNSWLFPFSFSLKGKKEKDEPGSNFPSCPTLAAFGCRRTGKKERKISALPGYIFSSSFFLFFLKGVTSKTFRPTAVGRAPEARHAERSHKMCD